SRPVGRGGRAFQQFSGDDLPTFCPYTLETAREMSFYYGTMRRNPERVLRVPHESFCELPIRNLPRIHQIAALQTPRPQSQGLPPDPERTSGNQPARTWSPENDLMVRQAKPLRGCK